VKNRTEFVYIRGVVFIADIRRKIKFGALYSQLVPTKPSAVNRGQSRPQSWQCDLGWD